MWIRREEEYISPLFSYLYFLLLLLPFYWTSIRGGVLIFGSDPSLHTVTCRGFDNGAYSRLSPSVVLQHRLR